MADRIAAMASLLNEDRGDGRSRSYALHLEARALLHFIAQRDGDLYVVRVTRLGMTYPRDADGKVRSFEGSTLGEAVQLAAQAMGCAVEADRD